MTEHEILDQYVELAQPVTGWPKWRIKDPYLGGKGQRRLMVMGESWFVEQKRGGAWTYADPRTYHEALCLWQHHAIKHLRSEASQRGASLEIVFGETVRVFFARQNAEALLDVTGGDLHDTLIAAMRAAKEK
jgi:hypothetical protein